MRFSLPSSLLLHGGLLAWAVIGFQETKPFKPLEPEPVSVAIITEDGLTRLRQGDRNAKQLESAPAKQAPPSQAVKETPKAKPPEPTPPPPPAAPPPEPVKVETPPPPPPKVAEPPPKPPEPKNDDIAELALKAEADAKAEAQRKAEADARAKAEADAKAKADAAAKAKADAAARAKAVAKAKAEAKAREEAKRQKEESFDDFMQKALKDNDPRKRAPQPSGAQQVAQANLPKGPQAGAPEGRDSKLTASEVNLLGSMMRDQVRRCWNLPAGADGVDAIVTEVEFRLSPNGQIVGAPRVVSRVSTPLHAAMADNAVRALIQCQPYSRFPQHLYKGGWDHWQLEFNPREMFR